MSEMQEVIIDYLVRNRVSTTEVADCLGKSGAIKGIVPVNKGHYVAGIIKWIYASYESNWKLHEQISDIEENRIILVDTFWCEERAVFGELVSKYLLLYKQNKAIVVKGMVRDAAALLRENYPIWCRGFNPEGCFNNRPDKDIDAELIKMKKEQYDGAIAVCDDCGVVIIPKDKITNSFLEKLEKIEEQEDIWFDRLDHYKENTFDIVCAKKYLKDESYMRQRKYK